MQIKNYLQDNTLSEDDRLLGIDANSDNTTKTYTIQSLKNFIQSRNKITVPVPQVDEVVSISTESTETYLCFDGAIVNNFIINISITELTEVGDKLYIFMKSDGESDKTITFTGDMNNVMCGDTQNEYDLQNTDGICLELVFDGVKFTGVDNC